MNTRDDDMYVAASMYYVQGETMDAIARTLNVSRSTVSRLLRDSRDTGLVRITLSKPTRTSSAISKTISKAFGVTCHVVPVKAGISDIARLEKVARIAAGLVNVAVENKKRLGIAWGTTSAAVVAHLPHQEESGLTIVQLNGGANAHQVGAPFVGRLLQTAADAYGATIAQFHTPAFFDHATTREALWQERSIKRVLELQRSCDVALFGVGTFVGPMTSHVYAAGYLDRADVEEIRRVGAVGDVCTVLLREDGTWADIPLNRRASGLTPREMSSIPRRICVCAGPARVAPLLGALRAQSATDLVIDDETALALIHRAGLRLE
ncbi:MAG: sugar-binding transcriptional regulator [Propionibacteriaceae bacterium]